MNKENNKFSLAILFILAIIFSIAIPNNTSANETASTTAWQGQNQSDQANNTKAIPKIAKNFAPGVVDTNGEVSVGANYDNNDNKVWQVATEIGQKIPYQVKTLIPKGTNYQTLQWDDILDVGLFYNSDVTITWQQNGTELKALEKDSDYQLTENLSGYSITFTQEGIKKVAEKTQLGDVEIIFNYTSYANGQIGLESPKNNNISFYYGDEEQTFVNPRENAFPISQFDTSDFYGDSKDTVNRITVQILPNVQENSDMDATFDGMLYLYQTGATPEHDKLLAVEYASYFDQKVNFEFLEIPKDSKDSLYVKFRTLKGTCYEQTGTIKKKEQYIPNFLQVMLKKSADSAETLMPTSPQVVSYGKRFVKLGDEFMPDIMTGTSQQIRLSNAEFVIKKQDENGQEQYLSIDFGDEATKQQVMTKYQEYREATDAYDNFIDDESGDFDYDGFEKLERNMSKKMIGYMEFMKKNRLALQWQPDKSEATRWISLEEGRLEIDGLAKGKYFIEEVLAPVGYIASKDAIPFTVEEGSYLEGDTVYGKKFIGDGTPGNVMGVGILNISVQTITITKDWQDVEGNPLDETYIPESITVNLFETIGGQKQPSLDQEGNQRSITIKSDEEGNWKGTFENLPIYDKNGQEIVYSVEEVTVPGFTTSQVIEQKVEEGSLLNLPIQITNKQKVRNLEVTKSWQDVEGNALDEKYIPESITVNLLANNEKVEGKSLTITKEDDWKGTFENLPIYDKDGQEIVYSVEEAEVLGFTITISQATEKEAEEGKVLDLAIQITNKQKVRNLEVTKSWQDVEGNALDEKYIPESITVNLLANGTKVEGKTLTITKEDDWKGQFENLPIYDKDGQEIVYSVEEAEVLGFTTTISQATEKEAEEGEVPDLAIQITNKQKVRNLEVTKSWQDVEGNALDETYIPESITVNLLANGTKVEGKTLTITKEDDWKGQFENLPIYDK
ncbi:Cna B-type domain-containing protein, partial [Granulicatella balaenopterae]